MVLLIYFLWTNIFAGDRVGTAAGRWPAWGDSDPTTGTIDLWSWSSLSGGGDWGV